MPHTVAIDGRARPVPATWNELDRPLLRRLAPLLYRRYPDAPTQRMHLLAALLGLPLAFVFATMTPVQFLEICWLTDFLVESVALTRLPEPAVWVHFRRYHGPADALNNLRFLEFVFADSYFVAYAQTQHVQWLDKLLAVLYRPGRWWGTAAAGDRRQPFNEHLVGRRAERLARLPDDQKLVLLTWYRGCRQALEQRYPRVFAAPREAPAADTAPDGWAFVLREMSGGAFGTLDETGQQNLHTVLAKMEDDARRAEQLRQQYEAQQAHAQ